jgi:UrcA family protein
MNTIIRPKFRAVLYGLCGAACLCSVQATSNAAANALPTRRVSYADLDISKTAGAKTLYRRIEAAARQVCEPDARKDLGAVQRGRACVKQAIDLAVGRVDSAALSKVHAATAIHLASN